MKRSIIIAFVFFFLWFGSVKAEEKVYHTTPEGFPTWQVTGQRDDYLFIANFRFEQCSPNGYLLILDGQGELVYYQRVPDCRLATDFKPQTDGGASYWLGAGGQVMASTYYRMSSAYTITHEYTRIGESKVDPHELLLLPNGNILLLYVEQVSLANVGGTIPNGFSSPSIVGMTIRELDAAQNIVFEWNSWEHFDLSDTLDRYLSGSVADYAHSNAIEVDSDGNLLLSTRHFDEITKIDRKTGAIIWRLGGKRNEFTLVGDNRWFSHQHDVRRLPNGHISLFDNGVYLEPAYSRYVEYAIDEASKVITLTKQVIHDPPVYSVAMGSARNLANDNLLIGWGSTSVPAVTEYTPQGRVAFELSLPPGDFSYRAYSGPWIGLPSWSPTVVEKDGILWYSWNGATEVAGYRIYGGASKPTTLIESKVKQGFEDSTLLQESYCTYKVVAVGKTGKALGETLHRAESCRFSFLPWIGGS